MGLNTPRLKCSSTVFLVTEKSGIDKSKESIKELSEIKLTVFYVNKALE